MRREMIMPMPENLPIELENEGEKIEKSEKEIEKEEKSWGKEAWGSFVNKLDEFKNSNVAIGVKMYAGDAVDFIKSKVEALSKSDRLSFLNGLAREGNYIVGAKNDLMEKVSENFSYNFKNEEMRRFFHNSAETFKEEKEKNYDSIAKIESGDARDLERIKGVGTGTGTLIKYAKLTAGATTPLGGALMGTMAAGHFSEVAKKTRLQAEKVIEKTRVGQLDENGQLIKEDDLDRAWDEAYRLYNEAAARNENGEVSAKDLDKIYQENLPKDILDRIERNENYEGLNLLQKGMVMNMKKCAEKVEAEFVEIENSDKTPEEKEAGKLAIIERNKKLLMELDGMVSDQGVVDAYAYLARTGEKTGKAATLFVTTYLGAEGLHRLYDNLKEINWDRFTDNVVNLGKHFKEYAGKAYDVIGPNKLGAEELNLHNQHIALSPYDQVNMRVKAEITSINRLSGGNLTPEAKQRLEELHKIQLAVLDAEKTKDISKLEKLNIPFRKEVVSGDGSGARQVPVSGGENIEVQKVAVENHSQPKHFQIAEKVTLKRGDSIWTVGEKHLEGNPDFHKLEGFLRIYNIDRVKDTIVAHPEKYGLKPGFNPEKMSAKQIQEIKWQQAFDDTFRKNGITTHLPKGHRGGGDHHHAVHREVPKSSSEAGKGDYTKEGGNKPLEAPVVPGTNVEVPPVDETKIYVDPHLVIDKGSQFADEYQTWGKASADDFLHGRFGEPIVAPEHYKADGKLEWEKPIVHKQADAAEIRHRNFLRERLQNAHDLIGDPKKGESVADFMARYNLKNADVNSSIYNHLKNEAIISGGSAVKAESWAIIDKMPSELKKSIFENFAANKGVAFGYVKMFFGDRGGVKDGIKAFFNYQGEVNPEDIKIKSDGSILYEDAFGKQGYDLQISREKIGVDGPGWNNLPKNRMNLDNISAAKRFILSGKTTEDNINDYFKMEKGEKIEKTFAEKVVETPRATELSEKQKPEIRIKPKDKIIDISTESPVPEKSPSTKVIDLSVEAEKGSAEIIKSIDAQIPKTDLKHFNELVLKYKDMSDNDLEEAVKAAPEGKERSLVAKAIAKVMEMRNLEDEKNF